MPYELTGDSVTSNLVIRLREIFPRATVTRNAIAADLLTDEHYPFIVIDQLTVDSQEERNNFWWINYLLNIRYHVVADPSSIPGSLQMRLDEAAMMFLSELDTIYFGDMPVRLTGRRTEKVDGVLHFFCDVSVLTKKPVDPGPMQETLDANITTAS